MPNAIVWFRRDLRLADHHTLAAAADALDDDGGLIPLFVVDPVLWDGSGANRRWFLRGCLADLDAQLGELGGRLVVRRGDPARVVPALAAAYDVPAVYRSQDVGVHGRRRDERVEAALAADDRELVEADSPWAVPPGTLRTGSGGSAYKVFTPYHRAWRGHRLPRAVARPSGVPFVDGVDGDGVPDADRPAADLPEPGEAAAHRALDRFLRARVDDYATARDRPGDDATSRLSPYLKFGCLHPRQVLRRLDGCSADHTTFAKELAWRDFYADILHEWPASAWRAWNPALAGMRLDTGARADERFAAWCEGRTGFPIVDAGMRQLVAEGWMHNRVRMITASFLVKDLHLDWTRGARFFLEHLVDGDLSSNNHGWQWVAGTGTDAAPYFRVFNPTSQGEKFDPDGTYVRRWVPELAGRARSLRPRPVRRPRRPAVRLPGPDRRPRRRTPGSPRPLRRGPRHRPPPDPRPGTPVEVGGRCQALTTALSSRARAAPWRASVAGLGGRSAQISSAAPT